MTQAEFIAEMLLNQQRKSADKWLHTNR